MAIAGSRSRKGSAIVLELQRLPAPAYADARRGAVAFGIQLERGGQDLAARPEQVDLDQADASLPEFLLLLDVQVAPGAGSLFEGLRISITVTTRRPDLMSMISNEALPHRLVLLVRQRRPRRPVERNPRPRLDDPTSGRFSELLQSARRILARRPALPNRRATASEVHRSGLIIEMMNIAPELLQVGVHPGKRAVHGECLRWQERHDPRSPSNVALRHGVTGVGSNLR